MDGRRILYDIFMRPFEGKMHFFIGIAIFITTVLLIEGSYFAFRTIHNPEQKRIRRRLRALSSGGNPSASVDIVRKQVLSEMPFLNNLLSKAGGIQGLARLLEQAGSPYPLGVFLLLSVLLGFVGLLLGTFVLKNVILNLLATACLAMAPFGYIYWQRQQRAVKFQRQLPDALELVARSLKAGHSFMVGMKMVGDEFADPIGTEFDETVDQINFGVGVPDALTNLAHRVHCWDLHFFVTSLMIQRETGGNLAEIIENISYLIRKRFELQGRVRALAAEGKLSAIILLALPFVLGLAIFALNPNYLGHLFTDPIGKAMMGCGGFTMALGAIVIKGMITIRV